MDLVTRFFPGVPPFRPRTTPWSFPGGPDVLRGLSFQPPEKTTAGFFLGDRNIPWGVACLSFIATEISAMTIIGVPSTGFRRIGTTPNSSSARPRPGS